MRILIVGLTGLVGTCLLIATIGGFEVVHADYTAAIQMTVAVLVVAVALVLGFRTLKRIEIADLEPLLVQITDPGWQSFLRREVKRWDKLGRWEDPREALEFYLRVQNSTIPDDFRVHGGGVCGSLLRGFRKRKLFKTPLEASQQLFEKGNLNMSHYELNKAYRAWEDSQRSIPIGLLKKICSAWGEPEAWKKIAYGDLGFV